MSVGLCWENSAVRTCSFHRLTNSGQTLPYMLYVSLHPFCLALAGHAASLSIPVALSGCVSLTLRSRQVSPFSRRSQEVEADPDPCPEHSVWWETRGFCQSGGRRPELQPQQAPGPLPGHRIQADRSMTLSPSMCFLHPRSSEEVGGGPGPLVLRNFSRSFQCRPSQARPPGVTAASPVTQVPCRGPPRQSVCRGPSPPGALTIDTAGGRGLTEPRRPVLPETAAGETEQSSAEPPAPFRGRKSRWVC